MPQWQRGATGLEVFMPSPSGKRYAISSGKDFGYSDVTEKNDVRGRVESLFHYSSNGAQLLSNVVEFYKSVHPLIKSEMEEYEIESLRIPTYFVNLPERKERRKHIEEQFKGRKEFDVTNATLNLLQVDYE